jgi:hypothetical protein
MAIIKSYKDIPKMKYDALELYEDGKVFDPTNKADKATEAIYGDNKMAEDMSIYYVRGMTPKELGISGKLSSYVQQPIPPKKKVEVKPLDNRGKIIPEDIHDEEELDFDDPDYLRRVSEWSQANQDQNNLLIVYQLVCCVEGFDPSDADIEEATGKKPPANDVTKITEYKKRLALIGDMILGSIDNRHLTQIMRKISERTGLSDTAINFS